MKIRTLLAVAILALTPAAVLAQNDAAKQAFMDAHHKMMAAMEPMMPSGNADKDFVTMMIPHHQGAIDMAEAELKYGKDPELLKMAQEIIDAQKAEIAKMQDWLSKNGG